jgi:hypothetical protein
MVALSATILFMPLVTVTTAAHTVTVDHLLSRV